MAQAVCDFGKSQLESISAASLSGMSVSLATGISQIQQLQHVTAPEAGGEEEQEEEEGKAGAEVCGREGGEREADGGAVEVEGVQNGQRLVTKSGARPPANMATVSPSTTTSEDGLRSLLESVPRVREEFEVMSKIGEGTFSSVYLGRLKGSGRSEMQFALKHLVPTSSSCRIENELRCLQSMGGRDNVVPLLTCVRHRDHVVLIMPYFPHSKLTDYLHLMTPAEVQRYMRGLFTALRNVHSHHIIHRDVKPSNFLYNRQSGRFQLVDFGLAHLESNRSAIASTPSSSSLQSARLKSQLRPGRVATRQSLATPPTSSSAQTTTNTAGTQRTPHTQVRVNGTVLLPPPATYRRQVHRKLHPQLSTAKAATVEEEGGGRGRDRRVGGRKRGKEGEEGCEGRLRDDDRVCPLRHKKTELCDVCQNRTQQNAPRAGTPGFRAPEVLLKCPHQTTAVDIWSAGVILLCLLSGRYPFFRASDDLSALAQIISLMGSAECAKVSRELGKELVCGQHIDPVDLRELCQNLRNKLHHHLLQQSSPNTANRASADSTQPPSKRNKLATASGCPTTSSPSCRYQLRSPQQRKSPRQPVRNTPKSTPPRISDPPATSLPPPLPSSSSSSSSLSDCGGGVGEVARLWESLPESAFDLLDRCLELHPQRRVSAEEALQHPFLADVVR